MIIGVAGTNGSGKGTVVDYLVSKGFTHYSVRAGLIEEIKKRGLPVDRGSMRDVANELRKTHEPAYLIALLYAEAVQQGKDAVIESVRNIGEAEFLQTHGARLVAVDAARTLRYERIVKRGSETDKVDFDTWVQEEEREWHNAAAHDMDVPAVMERADWRLDNSGTLAELHAQVDEALETLRR